MRHICKSILGLSLIMISVSFTVVVAVGSTGYQLGNGMDLMLMIPLLFLQILGLFFCITAYIEAKDEEKSKNGRETDQ